MGLRLRECYVKWNWILDLLQLLNGSEVILLCRKSNDLKLSYLKLLMNLFSNARQRLRERILYFVLFFNEMWFRWSAQIQILQIYVIGRISTVY